MPEEASSHAAASTQMGREAIALARSHCALMQRALCTPAPRCGDWVSTTAGDAWPNPCNDSRLSRMDHANIWLCRVATGVSKACAPLQTVGGSFARAQSRLHVQAPSAERLAPPRHVSYSAAATAAPARQTRQAGTWDRRRAPRGCARGPARPPSRPCAPACACAAGRLCCSAAGLSR